MEIPTSRICRKCKVEKPFEQFHKHKQGKYGYLARCKECIKTEPWIANGAAAERKRQSRARGNNLEMEMRRERLRNGGNPEYQRKQRERVNGYYRENETYREKIKKQTRDRQALKKQITRQDWRNVLAFFASSCAYCGSRDRVGEDHIVPISDGGKYALHNLVPACLSCNSSKSNKRLEIWFKRQSYYDENRLDKIYTWIEFNRSDKQMVLF